MDGWGAKVVDGNSTGGRWSATERLEHIKVLELKAAQLGLHSLSHLRRAAHIQIQLDNVTAVSYLREMGGSRSLSCNKLANEIWHWCLARSLWISVTHIPGSHNVMADKESRVFDGKTEWKLDSNAFAYCTELWGQPEIDMFASRLNYQFKPYVSWRPDPGACAIDAFCMNWCNKYLYIFPPFSLIPRVLKKLQEDGAKAILIVPQWPTQPWFPLLKTLSMSPPLLFARSKTLLTLPAQPNRVHPLYPKLRMVAYLLSARSSHKMN